MTKIRNTDQPEQLEVSYTGIVKWFQTFWKRVWQFLKKWSILPGHSISRYLPKRNEMVFLYTDLFITVHSFVCNSPKLEITQKSINKKIIKLRYTHIMTYYLSIRKWTYATTWLNPKIIMLSGRCEYTYCITLFI